MKQVNALGRRKSAVARVYVVPGKGNVVINGRDVNDYFKEDSLRYIVNQPFEITGTTAQFDRDAREVERKKPGQPGARRRFQFSKR